MKTPTNSIEIEGFINPATPNDSTNSAFVSLSLSSRSASERQTENTLTQSHISCLVSHSSLSCCYFTIIMKSNCVRQRVLALGQRTTTSTTRQTALNCADNARYVPLHCYFPRKLCERVRSCIIFVKEFPFR